MQTEVSVIVPVYNVAAYLPQCLDSLISQSFKDIEIICFNDASTDNSLIILKEYAKIDSRIKIIDSPVNVKQGGGRNRGLRESKGKYIMFVDSDDYVSPNFVESLYNGLKVADADICTADYYQVKNERLTEVCLLGKKLQEDTSQIKATILKNGCRLWTSIFKRELFFKNNLFFPENLLYEDNAIGTALFLSATTIKKIDDIVYYYRNDNTSTIRSRNNYHFFDRLETSIMMLENALRMDRKDEYRNLIEQYFIKLYYVNTLLGALNSFDDYPIDFMRRARTTLFRLFSFMRIVNLVCDNDFGIKVRIIVLLSLISPRSMRLIKTYLRYS